MITLPKITWGTSFANTITIQLPVDNANSYSINMDGTKYSAFPSGEEDAWVVDTWYIFDGDFRWIPTTTTANATGWDGATGWRAFLEWARLKNQFRFYPDKNSGTFYLSTLANTDDIPKLEPNGTRIVHLQMRQITSAYDGV